MREGPTEARTRPRLIALLAIGVCLVSICPSGKNDFGSLLLPASAQSTVQEKPTLKEFGSSLNRLKWDPAKQVAVEITRGERPAAAGVEDVIRIDTELVIGDILVRDKDGRAVPGLTQNDFAVVEDGQPQEIRHFSLGSESEAARSIVLVFDYSQSQYPYITTTVEAATALVDSLGPRDRMAIVTDDVELKVDFTRDKVKLKNALEDLGRRAMLQGRFGRSDQFSALMATVRELFSEEDEHRIVIFQTDGDELHLLRPTDLYSYAMMDAPAPGASEREKRKAQERLNLALSNFQPQRAVKEFGLNDISNAAERSRTTIYSIIPGWRFIGLSTEELLQTVRNLIDDSTNSRRGQMSRHYSRKLILELTEKWMKYQRAVSSVATNSGGFTSFLENPNQANQIYARILHDINSRYVIGYYPTNKTHDGKRRKVLIEVRNHPEYTIEGRKSYFAPGPEQ